MWKKNEWRTTGGMKTFHFCNIANGKGRYVEATIQLRPTP